MRARRRLRIGGSVLVGLVAGFGLGGCGGLVPSEPPPSRPPTASPSATPGLPTPTAPDSATPTGSAADGPSLLLLSGRPGAMTLERIAPDGRRSPVALPDPGVAWVSGGPGGRVVATTADGRLFVADAVTGTAAAWQPLRPGLGPRRLAGPLAFGTLDRDGSRVAVVAADYRAGATFDLVVVPVAGEAATRVVVPRPPDGSPPVWAGSRIIVLTRERQDRPGATLVDPSDGHLTDGPGGIALLAISADGATIALAGAVDGPIELRPVDAWLAGPTSAPSAVVDPAADPDGSRGPAWLALSAAGDRLAVVRTDADGAARRVDVYGAADGWRAARAITLPEGADRAAVAWLP